MTSPKIDIPMDKLAELCKRWKIIELSLFGSVLRDDFDAESDVDVMVRFAPNSSHSLFDFVAIESQIEEMLGRTIDLVTRSSIERGSNPFIRENILKNAEVFYAA